MKRVYLANDPVSANVLKLRLEENGIQAIVQDERTHELRGEVPLVYPSVWVGNEDEAAARKIALEFSHPQHGEPWTCQTCGEVLEASFADCWKCVQVGDEVSETPSASVKKANWLAYSILAAVLLVVGLGVYKAYMYDEFARHYQAAVEHHEADRYDAAIQEYDQSLAINPRSHDAWTSRGFSWYSKGDYERAVADLNKSLSLNPNQNRVYEYRAYAHFELGSPSKALRDYLTALSEHGFDNDLKLRIVACKYEIGDLKGALLDAESLRHSANFQYESALYRSYIFSELDQDAQARAEIEFAITLDPKNPEAFIQRAQYLFDQNEFERALAECEKAQTLGTDSMPQLMLTRGIIFSALNRQDDLRKEMKKILGLDLKTRYDIPFRLLAHTLLDNRSATDEDIQACLKASPEHRWSYVNAAAATNWLSRALDPEKRTTAQERVFEYLDEAKKRGFVSWHMLKNDPFLKDLTDHPRFKKLAGLP